MHRVYAQLYDQRLRLAVCNAVSLRHSYYILSEEACALALRLRVHSLERTSRHEQRALNARAQPEQIQSWDFAKVVQLFCFGFQTLTDVN